MMWREKVVALVLTRRNWGEADRLLTLFTREHGLLRVLAKGVRKVPSRRGGHLEPMTNILAIVSGGSGHYFLSAVETRYYFPHLREDRDALSRAQHMARLVVALLEEEQADKQLFEVLHQTWQMLPGLTFSERSLVEVAVSLAILRRGGVVPDLRACQQCGRTKPVEAVALDAMRGGWLCLSCLPHLAAAAQTITPSGVSILRYLAAQPQQVLTVASSDEEAEQLVESLRGYVALVAGGVRYPGVGGAEGRHFR